MILTTRMLRAAQVCVLVEEVVQFTPYWRQNGRTWLDDMVRVCTRWTEIFARFLEPLYERNHWQHWTESEAHTERRESEIVFPTTG